VKSPALSIIILTRTDQP